MASPLTVGIGALLFAGICLQLAAAWRHLRGRNPERDDVVYEKDVEWQLQHELDDAIEASSKASTPLINSYEEPTLPAVSSHQPHRVHFLDDPSTPPDMLGEHLRHPTQDYDRPDLSWWVNTHNFQRKFRPLLDATSRSEIAMPHISRPQHGSTPHGSSDAVLSETERPVYVNAKQYYRILKRREARAVLDAHLKAKAALSRSQRRETKRMQSD